MIAKKLEYGIHSINKKIKAVKYSFEYLCKIIGLGSVKSIKPKKIKK